MTVKSVKFLRDTYVVEGTVGAPDGAIFLDTLLAVELVELCNLLISQLDLGRSIKMFQSKAKGVKRVTALLVQWDGAFPDDDLPDEMKPDGPGSCPSPEAPKKPVVPTGKIRDGSKQAALIDLIKRPEGASIKEICAALNWVNHTARGAISRDLKKRLGLAVTKSRVEGRGQVYRIA